MSTGTSDPILLEIPEGFESERLRIRAPQWGDEAAVNEAIKESMEQLRLWMPWAQNMPTIEESTSEIRCARLKFLERKDPRRRIPITPAPAYFYPCTCMRCEAGAREALTDMRDAKWGNQAVSD